ncbi:MAG: trypsin-like serine protease [Pseudomonadota bacterium]|nr:trypsin-like serine protease [Pseudomonadota bacterium]
MSRLFVSSLALAALAGCAPQEELLPGAGPSGAADPKIYGGDVPDAAYHEAVVGIHERTKRGIYTQPFCSGTLIGDEWVLTAAHCSVSSRSRAKSASTFGIYVGNDPSVDLLSHLYYVDAVYVHASYSSTSLRNDIALLHLSTPITEVSPIAYLPTAEALSSADIGAMLNHAGFGYDETRAYGEKLQVDVPLGGFGCSVSGCGSAGDAATQISYVQTGDASGATGPCNGDSGGPAFITRGTTTYVAGITSYGDADCNVYGVSTRVDAYASWINTRTGL